MLKLMATRTGNQEYTLREFESETKLPELGIQDSRTV
jgi:hypothetical protein